MTNASDDELNDPSLLAALADDGEQASLVRAALRTPAMAPVGLARQHIDAALAAFDDEVARSAAVTRASRRSAVADRAARRRTRIFGAVGAIAAVGAIGLIVVNGFGSGSDEKSMAGAIETTAFDNASPAQDGAGFDASQSAPEIAPMAVETTAAPAAETTAAAAAETTAMLTAESDDANATAAAGDPFAKATPPVFDSVETLRAYPWTELFVSTMATERMAGTAPAPSTTAAPPAPPASGAPAETVPALPEIGLAAVPPVPDPAPSVVCPNPPGAFVKIVFWQQTMADAYVTPTTVVLLGPDCTVVATAPLTS